MVTAAMGHTSAWGTLSAIVLRGEEEDPLPYVKQPAASKMSTSMIDQAKDDIFESFFYLTDDTRGALPAKLATWRR